MLRDHSATVAKSPRQRGGQRRPSIPWKLACFAAAGFAALALDAAAFLGAIRGILDVLKLLE